MWSMLEEDHVRGVVSAALGPSQAEGLLALLRPSLRMVGGDGTSHGVRLGGPGLLEPGTSWPEWNGRPLTFLAEIDCAAIHALLPESGLPSSGTLTAWVHRTEELGAPEHLLGGATARHPGASRLHHHPAGTQLRTVDPPAETLDAATERTPRLVRDVMWPVAPHELSDRSQLGLTEMHLRVVGVLQQLALERDPDSMTASRIGGWPTLHGAATAAALVRAGIVDDRGGPDHRSPEADAVRAGADAVWHPLVQLGAAPENGWNWFLDGVLMFLARRGDAVGEAVAYCGRQ